MFRRMFLPVVCLLLLTLPAYAQNSPIPEQAPAAETATEAPAETATEAPAEPSYDPVQLALTRELQALTPAMGEQPIYLTEPHVAPPYGVGTLNPVYLQTGLDYTNFARRLAGLEPVSLSEHLCLQAQYGAVVLAAGDALSHSPEAPADMDHAFFRLGANICANSNISMRYLYQHETLLQSAVQGYLKEESAINRLDLGHRRWLLNPALGRIGFGLASSASGKQYIAMPIMDTSGTGTHPAAVTWPSEGQFPNSLFSPGTPWSVSPDPAVYQPPDETQLQVTLTRHSDGRIFTPGLLDHQDTLDSSGTYLLVSHRAYGSGPCISFSVGRELLGETSYLGDYTVSVSGLRLLDGTSAPLTYTVRFFDPAALSAPSVWAAEGLADAGVLQLVPQSLTDLYQRPITRLEFCRLTMQALRQASGLDNDRLAELFARPEGPVTFTDCSDPDVLAAAAIGAVRGMGDGTFRPGSSISRQDAAVLLLQTASALFPQVIPDGADYLDGAAIPDYAKPAVDWASQVTDPVTGSPVMAGVGDGYFDPRGTYTREQAVLTVLRLYRAAGLTPPAQEDPLPVQPAEPTPPPAED